MISRRQKITDDHRIVLLLSSFIFYSGHEGPLQRTPATRSRLAQVLLQAPEAVGLCRGVRAFFFFFFLAFLRCFLVFLTLS